MNKQRLVQEFMTKAGQDTPDKPTIPELEVTALRCRLILEELNEFIHASGVRLDTYTMSQHSAGKVEFKADFVVGAAPADIIEVADALADLLVVVYGAAVAWGISIDSVFGAVHESNMSKFIDGHKREDGKWIKGPSYTPVDLKPVLEAQGWEGA